MRCTLDFERLRCVSVGFINCKNIHILVDDADNGKGYASIGGRGSRDFLYLLQSCYEFKICSKIFNFN